MKKLPFGFFTRRQALTAASATFAAAVAQSGTTESRPARLLALSKSTPKEVLLKVAMVGDYLFTIWSTSLLKGSPRLACYDLNGQVKWSHDLGESRVFDIMASTSTEVTVATVEANLSRQVMELVFSKYDALSGLFLQKDTLPMTDGVIAVASNKSDICALTTTTGLVRKTFGVKQSSVSTAPPAFDTPTIGGLKPQALVASMHFIGSDLFLLDHVKARTLKVLASGEAISGRLSHPSIDALVQNQDKDVDSRVATFRSLGDRHAMTFMTSVMFAAADGSNGMWLVLSIGTNSASLVRLDPGLAVVTTLNVQIPDKPESSGKPPMLFTASQSGVVLGFQEGSVAIVDQPGVRA